MSALLAAGIEIDIFPIYPLDKRLWDSGLDIVEQHTVPSDHVHNLGLGQILRHAWPWPPRKLGRFLRDGGAIGASAARLGLARLASSAYLFPKAWAWAAEHADRYDHVLAYWGNYAGTCAYLFHRLIDRPIPFSIWLHAGTDLYNAKKRVFLRQKLAYADNIITCCEFNRHFMCQLYPDLTHMIEDKTHVCYHGLDLSTFPFAPDQRPPRHIIAVGRLAKRKGFEYLLQATRELLSRGNGVTTEFIGDGPELKTLEATARELGIADRVVFRGWLPFAEVRAAMSRATMLVHPSDGLGDGLPNVLREAMAVGTPVIASRIAGIPEALDDGRCGMLVPPRDVSALVTAIETLIADEALRHRYAVAGRRRTELLFDLWQNGAQLATRLKSAMRRQEPGRSVSPPEDSESHPEVSAQDGPPRPVHTAERP